MAISGSMKISRLIEQSIYFKLRSILSRTKTGENPKSADFMTYKLKYNNILTDNSVVVRVNGIVRLSNTYTVNYLNGLIKFNSKLLSSDIVSVDYSYCPINLYEEGQNPTTNNFLYPAVASYEFHRGGEGLELGNSKKKMLLNWVFEIWTERGGERNDIVDTIMELFEEDGGLTLIDYNLGFPVNSDGTINPNFNSTTQSIGYIDCDNIFSTKGGSLNIGEKPVFLSEINADLTITR